MSNTVAVRHATPSPTTASRGRHGWVQVEVDVGPLGEENVTGFEGRWLLPPDDDHFSRSWPRSSTCYGVGVGSDTSVYIYTYDPSGRRPRTLNRYVSLLSALSAGVPADIVAQAVGTDRTATSWLSSYLRARAG